MSSDCYIVYLKILFKMPLELSSDLFFDFSCQMSCWFISLKMWCAQNELEKSNRFSFAVVDFCIYTIWPFKSFVSEIVCSYSNIYSLGEVPWCINYIESLKTNTS